MYYQGIGHAFRTICREEGFLGLYKGLGATMLVRFSFAFPLFSCVICEVCLFVNCFSGTSFV